MGHHSKSIVEDCYLSLTWILTILRGGCSIALKTRGALALEMDVDLISWSVAVMATTRSGCIGLALRIELDGLQLDSLFSSTVVMMHLLVDY